jgi:hypothetical protein
MNLFPQLIFLEWIGEFRKPRSMEMLKGGCNMQPLTTKIRSRMKFITFHFFDNEYSQLEKHGPIYPYEGSSDNFS